MKLAYSIIMLTALLVIAIPSVSATPLSWRSLTATPQTVDAGDDVEIRASVSSSDRQLIFGCVREVPAIPEPKMEFFCDHEQDAVQSSGSLLCRGRAPFIEGEITLSCMARTLGGDYTDFTEVRFTVNPLIGNNPPVWRGLSIRERNNFDGGETVTIVADGASDRDGDDLYFGCTRSTPSIGSDPFIESSWNPYFQGEFIESVWGDVDYGYQSLQPLEYFSNPLDPLPFEEDIGASEYVFFCEDHEPDESQDAASEVICRGTAPFSSAPSSVNLFCGLHDGELHAEPLEREISFQVMPKLAIPPQWYGELSFWPRQDSYNPGDTVEIIANGIFDLDDDSVFFQCVDQEGNYACEHDIREPQETFGVDGVKCRVEIPYEASSQYSLRCSIHDGLSHAIFEGNEIFDVNIPLSAVPSAAREERGAPEEEEGEAGSEEAPVESMANRVQCSEEGVSGTVCDSTGVQQPAIFSKAQCKGAPSQILAGGEEISNPIFDPRIPYTCNNKSSTCSQDRRGVIMYSFDDCCQEGRTVLCGDEMECTNNDDGIGVCRESALIPSQSTTSETSEGSMTFAGIEEYNEAVLEDYPTIPFEMDESDFIDRFICSDEDISEFTLFIEELPEIAGGGSALSAGVIGYSLKDITGNQVAGAARTRTRVVFRKNEPIENVYDALSRDAEPYLGIGPLGNARLLNLKAGSALLRSFSRTFTNAYLHSLAVARKETSSFTLNRLIFHKLGSAYITPLRREIYSRFESVDLSNVDTFYLRFMLVQTPNDLYLEIDGNVYSLPAGLYLIPYPIKEDVEFRARYSSEEEGRDIYDEYSLSKPVAGGVIYLTRQEGAKVLGAIPREQLSQLTAFEAAYRGQRLKYLFVSLQEGWGEFQEGDYLIPHNSASNNMANRYARGDGRKSGTLRFSPPAAGSRLALNQGRMEEVLGYFGEGVRSGSSIPDSLTSLFRRIFGSDSTWETIGGTLTRRG